MFCYKMLQKAFDVGSDENGRLNKGRWVCVAVRVRLR